MIGLKKSDRNKRSYKNIKNSKNKLKFKIRFYNSNIMPNINSKYSNLIQIRPYIIQEDMI